ncbi:MAG: hypothetical protein U1E76_21455 [Planctomycetota bacterium]
MFTQLRVLPPLVFVAATALAQENSQVEETTVERGVAYPVIESTFDHPQIQVSDPQYEHKAVHPPKIPPAIRRMLDQGIVDDLMGGQNPPTTTSQTNSSAFAPAIDFAGQSDTGWLPPDNYLATGPSNVVEIVNETIAFYTKSGSLQFSQILNNTGSPGFFESVGCSSNTFDPKCLYDQNSGRFVVVALEVPSGSTAYIDIAVSDDSDPNGTWYKYRTSADTVISGLHYWVDYPGLGIDSQAIYVTGNLFPQTSGSFGGVKYRIFDKTPMLSGGAVVFSDLRSSSSESVQVAHVFGSSLAPFFVSVNSTSSIRLQAITNPLSSPALVASNVTVPTFSLPTSGAPQKGTSSTIDVLDGRMMNAAWRNGHLYAGHGIKASSKNQARWYDFNTNNWPSSGSPTLSQSGNIDAGTDTGGQPIHTWFPVIVSNPSNDIGVVLARSSKNEYAGVYYTGRTASDAPGTMAPLTLMKVGTAGYDCSRWGDYFGVAVDPSDGTFWGVGEYASGSCTWKTWIGNFQLSTLRSLTVNATGVTNVNITVSPPDSFGQGDGTTPFSRSYSDGVVVSLTAPSTASSEFFYRWLIDGVGQPSKQQGIAVTMTAAHTTTAAYLPCLAFWTNYGSGWPGTNGVPSFSSNANPIIGTSITLNVGNSLGAATTGFVALGFSSASTPTIYGGTLLVVPSQFLAIPLLAGTTPLPGTIPADESLCGLSVYLQVLEIDPGASAGISFTRGLQLAMGV